VPHPARGGACGNVRGRDDRYDDGACCDDDCSPLHGHPIGAVRPRPPVRGRRNYAGRVSAPTTPPPAPAPEPAGAGIPGSELPGPYGVGEYASALRARLRAFARVQLVGELVNLRPSRARVYFELRDFSGAIGCAVWLSDWESILARTGAAPVEGMQVVVAGGCDFYPGSTTSSPGFSFSVSDLRVAGEGDLLARIERLRRGLDAEGLLAPQKLLPRPLLPRTIGVVTAETGKAREDILAGLARRGWAGRIVWGFAPVQDRHAATLIARALTDLAAVGGVDVAIVARGGGSLADLLCFCDESLCRTVALLGVPVIASVGHHTDRTLLDDVAAVSCSTPTHAAEAAVGLDCTRARAGLVAAAARMREHGRRAVLSRARTLTTLSRAPSAHVERQRALLHQRLREVRAGSRRRVQTERELTRRRAIVLERKSSSTVRDCRSSTRRPQELQRLTLALAGHDPQHTLERGYALVTSRDGEPIATAAAAGAARKVRLRFADDTIRAKIVEP
jgi:exodeoxyribonuclease VII large subunit